MSLRPSTDKLPSFSASAGEPSKVEEQPTLQMRDGQRIIGFDVQSQGIEAIMEMRLRKD